MKLTFYCTIACEREILSRFRVLHDSLNGETSLTKWEAVSRIHGAAFGGLKEGPLPGDFMGLETPADLALRLGEKLQPLWMNFTLGKNGKNAILSFGEHGPAVELFGMPKVRLLGEDEMEALHMQAPPSKGGTASVSATPTTTAKERTEENVDTGIGGILRAAAGVPDDIEKALTEDLSQAVGGLAPGGKPV